MARPRQDRYDRFQSAIDKTERESGCWIWTGMKTASGYGRFFSGRVEGKIKWFPAHRFAWEFFRGPITDGMSVCHTCDQKPCVNPEHLFLGTHADNMEDRNKKWRQAKGEQHGMSKLTGSMVVALKEKVSAGRSIYSLAKETGLNESTISRAVRGVTWKRNG